MTSNTDDLFCDIEAVCTEPVLRIHSNPSHTFVSISLTERNALLAYITDRIFDEVTDPLKFNKSDASVNAHTLCDMRTNIEMSKETGRSIMQAYLDIYFPAHAMIIPESINYKHASVQKAIKNKRAYTDIRDLIFSELKTHLRNAYMIIKAEKKQAIQKAKAEAERAEEIRIQNMREENKKQKEADRRQAEEAEELANRINILKNIVLDIADDEWD